MSPAQTATTALMLGMSVEDLMVALEQPVPGECFPLDEHCGRPLAEGRWLCDEHESRVQFGSSPRLREVAR